MLTQKHVPATALGKLACHLYASQLTAIVSAGAAGECYVKLVRDARARSGCIFAVRRIISTAGADAE